MTNDVSLLPIPTRIKKPFFSAPPEPKIVHQPAVVDKIFFPIIAALKCGKRWRCYSAFVPSSITLVQSNDTEPSSHYTIASDFHQRVVIAKCFSGWRMYVYSGKKKWKLKVRAQVKYQYSLLAKAIQGWKLYIKQQQDHKMALERVDTWAKDGVKAKVLKSWKNYIYSQRKKKQAYQNASIFHCDETCYKSFTVWKKRLQSRREKAELENLNNSIAKYHFLGGFLRLWGKKLQRKRILCTIEEKIKRKSESWYLRVVVRSWLLWTKQNMFHAEQKENAALLYKKCLCTNLFDRWKKLAKTSILRKHVESMAIIYAGQHCVSVYFRGWLRVTRNTQTLRQRLIMASSHYEQYIKSAVLHSMKLVLIHKSIADKFHFMKILSSFYYLWRDLRNIKLEEREEREVNSGSIYFSKKKTEKSWNHWRSLFTIRIREKIWRDKALEFRRIKLKTKIVKALKVNCLNENRIAKLESMGKLFYIFSLQGNCFRHWRKKNQITKCVRSNNEMAAIYRDNALLKLYFRYMITKHRNNLGDVLKEIKARSRFMQLLKRKVFCGWRSIVRSENKKRDNVNTSLSYFQNSVHSRYFLQWLQSYRIIRHEKLQYESAGVHYNNATKKRIFLILQENVTKKLKTIELKLILKSQSIKRYFSFWKKVFDLHQKQRSIVMKHIRKKDIILLQAVMRSWADYSKTVVKRKKAEDLFVLSIQAKLNNLKLRRILSYWIEVHESNVFGKRMKERAIMMNMMNFKKKAFFIWICKFRCSQWHKKAGELAFRHKYLHHLRISFEIWKAKRPSWIELYIKKNIDPYLYRSNIVQKTVFKEWQNYIIRKKNKAIEEELAYQKYKKGVLTDAVIHILRITDRMRTIRSNYMKKVRSRDQERKEYLAEKYFKNWKEFVEKKIKMRKILSNKFEMETVEPVTDIESLTEFKKIHPICTNPSTRISHLSRPRMPRLQVFEKSIPKCSKLKVAFCDMKPIEEMRHEVTKDFKDTKYINIELKEIEEQLQFYNEASKRFAQESALLKSLTEKKNNVQNLPASMNSSYFISSLQEEIHLVESHLETWKKEEDKRKIHVKRLQARIEELLHIMSWKSEDIQPTKIRDIVD